MNRPQKCQVCGHAYFSKVAVCPKCGKIEMTEVDLQVADILATEMLDTPIEVESETGDGE